MGWEALCKGKNILVFGHAWFEFSWSNKISRKINLQKNNKAKT